MKTFFKVAGVLILLAAAVFGYIFYMGSSRGPEISERVTDFMYLASGGDADSAYEFFSEDLKQAMPLEDFEAAIGDHFSRLNFVEQKQAGYYFFIGTPASSKFNIFKLARIYEYQGIVTYSRGYEGELFMVFVKEGGQWKLIAFNLVDPYSVSE